MRLFFFESQAFYIKVADNISDTTCEKINFICVIEFFHLILISKNIITVHHGIYITGMLR